MRIRDTLLRSAQPRNLFLAVLTYFLGAGIAKYLGHSIKLLALVTGLGVMITIFLTTFWLKEYFYLQCAPLADEESVSQRNRLRAGLFQSSLALLTVSGAIFVIMLLTHIMPLPAGIFLVLTFILSISYAVPPMQLVKKGYGELVQAVLLGTIYPAFAFLIQFGDLHRLLPFITFPLTMLALAYFLLSDFKEYSQNQKDGYSSLAIRLSWQRAIPVHHLLILISFLFFAISPFLGFPWRLVWPVFLLLPFAIIQIVWLHRIALGGRTLWRFFIPFAAIFLGLMIYLLSLSVWIQ
jgi:1,4-dihydroxy-2-naphthoate octaprenyltransferase